MGKRKRARSAKREGAWGGIQSAAINVPLAGLFLDLNHTLTTDDRARTMTGVRGFLDFNNAGSDAATGAVFSAAKLMKANLNDALVITDDTQAIDVDLEDIQQRQLWTWAATLQARSTLNTQQHVHVEVRVVVDIKLPVDSKVAFGMFVDASVVNRLQVSGYLRAYYKFG